ncbi:MAG: GNAT family N-acetyltransferase [Neisseriaceae bacterium]|nr:GNAT family N-acetyltransferase [Neisseriaceae bacterium]
MSVIYQHYQPHQFEDYLALVSDERVMAMITERGLARAEAQVDFAQLLQENARHPHLGNFRVEDAATGAYLGFAKLVIAHADAVEAELGYMLLPQYWGQGWGTQLAEALLARARDVPQLQQLVAIIDPQNVASRHILTRLGFVTTEVGTWEGLPAETLRLRLAPVDMPSADT